MKRRDVIVGLGAASAWPAAAQTVVAPAAPVRVELITAAGRIVIDLAVDKAPLTTANFLRYVDRKLYDKATIFRASRVRGAPEYGLIEGGLQGVGVLKPVPHESTTLTGLKHVDGTISLARAAPGTGTSDFFICVGPAASLDANPGATGDNAGFAAFGQVSEGIEVVRQILAMPTPGKAINPVMQGEILDPPLAILKARRLVSPA
jgi:peptidyl-prolyl cis-trans isomerase A (cyclophilin A)